MKTPLHSRFETGVSVFKVNSLAFFIRLLAWGSLLALGVNLVVQNHWGLFIVGVVINGVMLAHGTELQHQCLHFTGFRSRKINVLSGVLLGLPTFVSFFHYRDKHLQHHKFVGTAQDEAFFNYDQSSPINSFPQLVRYLYSPERILALVRQFGNRSFWFNNAGQKDRIIRYEYILQLTILGVLATTLITSGYGIVILSWAASFFLVSEPLHRLIELPEHHGCEKTTDIYRNTTTITSSPLLTWLTNSNNLHVEHHLYPAIPMQNLPVIHEQHHRRSRFSYKGYAEFFGRMLAKGRELAPSRKVVLR